MTDELLTPAEAARRLGVSTSTLRRWDESGDLMAARRTVGGHRRFDGAEVAQLADDLADDLDRIADAAERGHLEAGL